MGNKRLAVTHSHLDNLKIAMEKVDPHYVKLPYGPNINEEEIIQVERSFAYELYYHWHKIIDKYNKKLTADKKLQLNGEIPKKFFFKDETQEVEGKSITERRFPDMVLHKGQDDHNIDNQILICEIKRKTETTPTQKAIHEDLVKLSKFVSILTRYDINYSFQNAAFIFVNISNMNMIGIISEAIINYGKIKHADKIQCFSYEVPDDIKNKPIVKYISLAEIQAQKY